MRNSRLNHQVYSEPPVVQLICTVALSRSSDGIAALQVVERCKCFLFVVGVHGVTSQELPALVGKQT